MNSISFQFKGKSIELRDYTICDNVFSKLRGLMFRAKNDNQPLLFVFNKPGRYAIHSFFCRKFLAVWMLDGKVLETKIVEPWKLAVTPKRKFNFLVEIPFITLEKLKLSRR